MDKLKFYGNLVDLIETLKKYKLYDMIYNSDQEFKIKLNNIFNLNKSILAGYNDSHLKIDTLRQFVDGIRIDHENNINLIFITIENIIKNNISIEGEIINYISEFIQVSIKEDNCLLDKVEIFAKMINTKYIK